MLYSVVVLFFLRYIFLGFISALPEWYYLVSLVWGQSCGNVFFLLLCAPSGMTLQDGLSSCLKQTGIGRTQNCTQPVHSATVLDDLLIISVCHNYQANQGQKPCRVQDKRKQIIFFKQMGILSVVTITNNSSINAFRLLHFSFVGKNTAHIFRMNHVTDSNISDFSWLFK